MDMIRFHSLWKDIDSDSLKYAIPGLYSNNTKGFVLINNYAPGKLKNYTGIKEQMQIPTVAEDNLNELISYLKEKKQEAIFVVAPFQKLRIKENNITTLVRLLQIMDFSTSTATITIVKWALTRPAPG